MLSPDVKITTEVLWRGALMFALIDLFFVPFLAWRIKSGLFHQMKWTVVGVSAVYWFLIWAWVMNWDWDAVYRYVFPDWMRLWLPPEQGLLAGIVALVLWWSGQRISRNPVLGFCLLGGLWGILTHVWAVQLGIVDKPPPLQGASPVAAVVVAIFEFMFYWCIILSVSALLSDGWHWLKGLLPKRPLAAR